MQFKNIADHVVNISSIGDIAVGSIVDTKSLNLLDCQVLGEWGIYAAIQEDCICIYKSGATLTKQESLDYFISPNL